MRCARRCSSGTGRTDGDCRGGATRRHTTGRPPASTALRPAHQRRRLPRPRRRPHQWLPSLPTACGSPRSCASRRASRPSFRTGSRGWRHSRLSRRSPRRARRRSTRAGRGWASTGGHASCTREASRRARSAATAAALLHLPPPPPPLRSPSRLPRYQEAHHSTHTPVLHACVVQVVADFGGVVPTTVDELMSPALPVRKESARPVPWRGGGSQGREVVQG